MPQGLLKAGLITALALCTLSASAQPGPDHRGDRREDRREDKTFWRDRDQAERRYWQEHGRDARHYERHRYEVSPHHYRPPAWMEGYWRPGERRYVALVPGDPSRMYVFLGNRWVLREVRDRRARLDVEGAFALPVAPPPIPPPVGLNLHVVLFD
ncbi:hypothetical protein [Geothrix sp. 21YS21S-4]|uniref:hypothetical protein n=1 Tax=Geothrix sp. 21YS21S-4 TaxID=3068889 RepID=UPI0027BB0CAA|nr:hypothetical protein [Geothrix sp. 21YS21S-4]